MMYVYVCERVSPFPCVCGDLDRPAWQEAARVKLVDIWGDRPQQETSFRMVHDGSVLYIGFEVWDEEVLATFTQRDDKVWMEEAVELFIAPGSEIPNRYYEFQLSPRNVLRDVLVTYSNERTPVPDGSWDCRGVVSAVHLAPVKKRGKTVFRWTAEIGIPLGSLAGDAGRQDPGGQVWRANLFRIDRRPRLEYSCWSPTYQENFHVPSRFGRLVFR